MCACFYLREPYQNSASQALRHTLILCTVLESWKMDFVMAVPLMSNSGGKYEIPISGLTLKQS